MQSSKNRYIPYNLGLKIVNNKTIWYVTTLFSISSHLFTSKMTSTSSRLHSIMLSLLNSETLTNHRKAMEMKSNKTKLFGDIACLKNNPSSIIIRTCWLYSSFCKNFVTNMINLMKSKSELKVINDQFGSPTYAGDLAKTILDLITHKNWIPGIYHFTNLGKVSWFDFANDIKSIYGFNTSIDSISSKEYSIKTKRPKYSLLDNSKIKNTFDIIQMNYLDSLNKCIKILQNES